MGNCTERHEKSKDEVFIDFTKKLLKESLRVGNPIIDHLETYHYIQEKIRQYQESIEVFLNSYQHYPNGDKIRTWEVESESQYVEATPCIIAKRMCSAIVSNMMKIAQILKDVEFQEGIAIKDATDMKYDKDLQISIQNFYGSSSTKELILELFEEVLKNPEFCGIFYPFSTQLLQLGIYKKNYHNTIMFILEMKEQLQEINTKVSREVLAFVKQLFEDDIVLKEVLYRYYLFDINEDGEDSDPSTGQWIPEIDEDVNDEKLKKLF